MEEIQKTHNDRPIVIHTLTLEEIINIGNVISDTFRNVYNCSITQDLTIEAGDKDMDRLNTELGELYHTEKNKNDEAILQFDNCRIIIKRKIKEEKEKKK